jgi:hypothetical protein
MEARKPPESVVGPMMPVVREAGSSALLSSLDEGQVIPLGDDIFSEWRTNGQGELTHSLRLSAHFDVVREFTLRIKRGKDAVIEGYIIVESEKIGEDDEYIYFSGSEYPEEGLRDFGTLIRRPPLKALDVDIEDFAAIRRNSPDRLELAKSLLERLPNNPPLER